MSRIKFFPRIFATFKGNNIFSIEKSEYDYLRVVRQKINEAVEVVDLENNKIFFGILSKIAKDYLIVQIDSQENFNINKPSISLAFSICSKENTRDILDFATQVGVKEIIPFVSDYSYKNSVSFLEKKGDIIINEALRQCRASYRPELYKLNKIDELVNLFNNYSQVIVADIRTNNFIKDVNLKGENFLVVVGPESGFTDKDIEVLSSAANVNVVQFYGNIMRSQVAVVSVLSQVKVKIN